MKKNPLILLSLALHSVPTKAQSDQELSRDSIIGWQYISNPPNAKAVYKPVKSQYADGATYCFKGRYNYYHYYHCSTACGCRYKADDVNGSLIEELRKYSPKAGVSELY